MASHSLDALDEPRASLRILVTLSSHAEGVKITNLYNVMRTEYGLGRTAVDTSINALIEAGLITKYGYENGKSNLKIINLTEFGDVILRKVIETAELMEKNRG